MTVTKKSASDSRAIRLSKSNWNSISMAWTLKSGTPTNLAFSEYVFPSGFDPKPYINPDSLKAIGDDGLPRPIPPVQVIRRARKRVYFETLTGSKIEVPQPQSAVADKTYTAAPSEAVARINMDALKMARNSTGVMCTEVHQWLSVEVECKSAPTTTPAIHVWAFLQPAKIGGNTGVLAGDNRFAPDDYPRSGWAEYMFAVGGKSCVRRSWVDGKLKEETVPATQYSVEAKTSSTFLYRIRLTIKNDRTPGDVARANKQKGPARPLDDYEAGCWLKAWVRDPDTEWGMDPADDESNSLAIRMDQMDPTSESFSWTSMAPITLGSHAFLRSRLMYDPSGKGDLAKARPIYAMLFTPEVMDNIVELDRILHPKEKSAKMQVASIIAVSSLTLLLAYALRRALEQWQKATKDRPANTPAGIVWPDWANKEKAEFFVKMLESFDVAALLAAYASDGFENGSPIDVVASTGSSNPQMVKVLAAIYGQIFDMAFAQSPLHYKEFMLKRLEARTQALEERIKWSKKGAANRAAEAEEKKVRDKKLEEFRKQKGLGLFATSSRAGLSVTDKGVNFKFKLAEGSKKQSFPKPAGAPLPIAGVPLVWRLDLSASGSLDLEILIEPGKTGDSLDLTFGLKGSAEASAAFGIHALWSGLEDPEALAHMPSLETDWKRKTGQNKATDQEVKQADKDEYYANKKALRELRESAVAHPPPTSFQLFRLLKELNQAVRLDAVVTAALKLKAGIGVKISLDSTTGERKISFKGDGESGFSAALTAEMTAQLQASLLSVDYPIAGLPELGTLSSTAISANLSGNILGKSFPGKQWQHKWGKGDLGMEILQENGKDFMVWGRLTNYLLTYTDMETPDVSINLLRTPTSTDPVVGTLPKAAVSCEQKGAGGTIRIALQLSCRAQTNQPHVVAVGGWSLSEGVGKAVGRDVGSKETPARTFLEELTRAEASAKIIVHAKDLVPTHVYSKSITVFSPRVVDQILLAKPGILMVTLTLGYFEDDHLWVQLREFNSILADPVLPNQGKPWLPFPLQGIKTTDKGRQGILQIPLNKLTFPRAKEDVWEVYPVLSLVPHDCGVINKKWFPKSDSDQNKYVRVKS